MVLQGVLVPLLISQWQMADTSPDVIGKAGSCEGMCGFLALPGSNSCGCDGSCQGRSDCCEDYTHVCQFCYDDDAGFQNAGASLPCRDVAQTWCASSSRGKKTAMEKFCRASCGLCGMDIVSDRTAMESVFVEKYEVTHTLDERGCLRLCAMAGSVCSLVTYRHQDGKCFVGRVAARPKPEDCDTHVSGWTYFKGLPGAPVRSIALTVDLYSENDVSCTEEMNEDSEIRPQAPHDIRIPLDVLGKCIPRADFIHRADVGAPTDYIIINIDCSEKNLIIVSRYDDHKCQSASLSKKKNPQMKVLRHDRCDRIPSWLRWCRSQDARQCRKTSRAIFRWTGGCMGEDDIAVHTARVNPLQAECTAPSDLPTGVEASGNRSKQDFNITLQCATGYAVSDSLAAVVCVTAGTAYTITGTCLQGSQLPIVDCSRENFDAVCEDCNDSNNGRACSVKNNSIGVCDAAGKRCVADRKGSDHSQDKEPRTNVLSRTTKSPDDASQDEESRPNVFSQKTKSPDDAGQDKEPRTNVLSRTTKSPDDASQDKEPRTKVLSRTTKSPDDASASNVNASDGVSAEASAPHLPPWLVVLLPIVLSIALVICCIFCCVKKCKRGPKVQANAQKDAMTVQRISHGTTPLPIHFVPHTRAASTEQAPAWASRSSSRKNSRTDIANEPKRHPPKTSVRQEEAGTDLEVGEVGQNKIPGGRVKRKISRTKTWRAGTDLELEEVGQNKISGGRVKRKISRARTSNGTPTGGRKGRCKRLRQLRSDIEDGMAKGAKRKGNGAF